MKDPALRKRKKRQFESLDVATIKAIRHADALAVWVLLSCMPDDWRVSRLWLRRQLGFGKDRLKGAVARLTELGLWWVELIRDEETGRLAGSEIWISDEIDPPRCQVSGKSENRTVGKAAITQNEGFDSSEKSNHPEGGCDGASAPKSKTFHIPDGVPGTDRFAIQAILSELTRQQRSDVLAVLASKLDSPRDKPIRSFPGFIATLATKAKSGTLSLPSGAADSRRAAEIEARRAEAIAAFEAGKPLLLDGDPAALDGRWVRSENTTIALTAAIAKDRIHVGEA